MQLAGGSVDNTYERLAMRHAVPTLLRKLVVIAGDPKQHHPFDSARLGRELLRLVAANVVGR